jgi:hypothetical protein
MRPRWALVLGLLVVLAGCGSDRGSAPEIPDGVIAKVGERELTGTDLRSFLSEVAASYDARHRSFPETGSPEHWNLVAEAEETLVEGLQLDDSADWLGVNVTHADVEALLSDLAAQNNVDSELAKNGVSLERVRADLRWKLLRNRIFATVVASARPTDDEIRAYYDSHLDDYTRWPPRRVDYVFVRDEALARDMADRMRAGEDVVPLVEAYGDKGVDQGHVTFTDEGAGMLPFQRAAFTLPVGEVAVVQAGVGWSVVKPVSTLEPGHVIPFAEIEDGLRVELTQDARKEAMDSWTAENDARLASSTSYAAGWDPSELRRDVVFPLPPEPQKGWSQCGLPDGEYTYEELVDVGCAGDFPVPGVDGPPCPVPLVDDPFTGGFRSAELNRGYADYLTDDESSCVPDPRGETRAFFRRLAPPRPGLTTPAG